MGCAASKGHASDNHQRKPMSTTRKAAVEESWAGEEEKKENSPTGRVTGAARTLQEQAQGQSLEEMQRGLPGEIKKKKYKCERDLLNDLEELCRDDLQIIRNKDGYAVWREMPGEEHRVAVKEIERLFNKWKLEHSLQAETEKESNIFVAESAQGNAKRVADLGLYGPSRLTEDGRIRKHGRKCMNPHVIFQLSWGGDIEDEKAAVEDMMNYAGKGDYLALERPYVAYLIKILRKDKTKDSSVYGFDVYEIRRDRTTPDDPTVQYRVGGNQEGVITVTARELDLAPSESTLSFTFTIDQIRQELEDLDVAFVQPPKKQKT
jgi:hypothetical protein